ncbi:uncharacterized protein LOC131950133 [Physella acuta]|uniref:uncharacterized protein LOC131950133 n=1 Tax=Physella acuta TaxID=109671 RepID=UPI0027DD01A2|nr:uncharacterized protein LOC131950133 [Physella acuta]
MWYNRSHDVQFNGSPTLSITAFDISQDYYCMARKYNISSNNVTYSATLKGDETENQLDIYWIIVPVTVVVLMCFVIVLLVAKHNKFTYRKYRKLRAYQSNSKKRKKYEVHIDNDDIFNLNSAKCIEI